MIAIINLLKKDVSKSFKMKVKMTSFFNENTSQ
jgi:hypothetical protein